jgi:hypothetical protein
MSRWRVPGACTQSSSPSSNGNLRRSRHPLRAGWSRLVCDSGSGPFMVALRSCRCAGHHEGPKATKVTNCWRISSSRPSCASFLRGSPAGTRIPRDASKWCVMPQSTAGAIRPSAVAGLSAHRHPQNRSSFARRAARLRTVSVLRLHCSCTLLIDVAMPEGNTAHYVSRVTLGHETRATAGSPRNTAAGAAGSVTIRPGPWRQSIAVSICSIRHGYFECL